MPSSRPEPRWPASLALLTCAALYFVLPNRLVVGPQWVLPLLIVLPLIPLSITKHRHPDESPWVRRLSIALVALVTVANLISMSLLVRQLLVAHVSQGRNLIYSAVAVWFTNIISFGLWYWEIDRGGPHMRAGDLGGFPDIQFPQMENPTLAPAKWHPKFFDYLYSSFANGTSFAPADAMPLSLRVKALFLAESLISFVTVAIVAARAVNILH
jgi:uncharacterized membrane protein